MNDDFLANPQSYTVINDDVILCAVLTADILRVGKSQDEVRDMEGEDYSAWCGDVPTASDSIELCEALIAAGAKLWRV